MRKRIVVDGVSKVFGQDPSTALALLKSGEDKDSILKATNAVVGLNHVSFDVSEGEILVVMGLSGSGKSTMIRCINRLVEPTAGSILVDGVEVTTLSNKDLLEFRRSKFGMVFQHFALFPHRNILENVAYGLEVQKVRKPQRTDQAMQALEVVGLKGWEKKYPSQLSGGMQQRAGLARALAVNADILLMDEAFSALDPLIRRDMQQELSQLQRNLHKTIVFVSHDLDEAIHLGGRIVLMKDGEIVQIGWPEEILTRPATDYVRRFVEHIDVSSVVTVQRLADVTIPVLRPQFTVAEARRVTSGSDAEAWFVVDDADRAIGRVAKEDLASCPSGNVTVSHVMQTEFARLQATSTLKSALPALASQPDGVAIVRENEQFVGSLTSRCAVAALAGAPQPGALSSPANPGGTAWSGQFQSSRSTNSAIRHSTGLPSMVQP